VKLALSHEVDDGAVFYLNGVEISRFGLAVGASYDFSTLFADHEANEVVGPIDVPAARLLPGDNVFAAEIHQVSTGSSDIVFGAQLAATVPLVPATTKVLAFNDDKLWTYNNTGADLGTAWRAANYNDSAWPKALQPLGENNDKSEVIPARTFVSRFNADGVHYTTLYVRGHFTFPGTTTAGAKLSLIHQIDDGAVFYLNGVEINRFGLAAGAPYDFSTLFADHEASALVGPIDISTASLALGDNVFAAEIHQVSTGSSDIMFGAELTATTYGHAAVPKPVLAAPTVVGGTITIKWSNGGTLYSAPSLDGTFTTTGNSSGTFSESASGSAKFYRVQQ